MNGTINLKKLATKILDAISTLNTQMEAVDGKVADAITRNNEQTLAIVEYNAEAASRDYTVDNYLILNGKLYKTLNAITQGEALQEGVNIEWVRTTYEIKKIKEGLKNGAFSTVANNLDTATATGYILDARVGPKIKNHLSILHEKTNQYIRMKYVDIPGSKLSNGMNISSYITVDDGYYFRCWMPFVATSGFIGTSPAYLINAMYTSGGFYCNNINKASSAYYRCFYLEFKTYTHYT